MTPSAREVSLRRQEEEVVHDGDGVGDDPQQPVLPLGRLHQVAVLVQVVQQQREPRLPQRRQLAAKTGPRLAEKRSRNRRMWPAL